MGVVVFCAEKRGWAGRKNAFFICFGMNGHDLPHPRLSPYTPEVETPAHSAPGRTAQHRQQHRPYQMQGRPRKARHTRPDAGHAAPGRSGRRRGWSVCATCPKLSRYGRLSSTPKQAQKSSLFCVCLLPVQLYKYTKKCYYNVRKNIH